ncbi:hypothetical protein X12_001182 [Xanthomonas arboricola]|uniref:hypothetical protein n=1 Tax=Xanthomonas arboricola TaxID=56448 RepID=UPI002B28C7E4|nr:hypothetical protein X12_001182 [Xanthomonas arboricola]
MDDLSKLHLILVPDPAEPHWTDAEIQEIFQMTHRQLKDAGCQVSAVVFLTRDAVSTSKLVGEFAVPLAQVFGPVIASVVVTWLTGRAGRKLKLKVGDVELEANNTAKVDHLIEKALEMKERLASADKAL